MLAQASIYIYTSVCGLFAMMAIIAQIAVTVNYWGLFSNARISQVELLLMPWRVFRAENLNEQGRSNLAAVAFWLKPMVIGWVGTIVLVVAPAVLRKM